MAAVDLAAIRADLAAVRAPVAPGQPLVATTPLPIFAVNALDRILQTHLPALLALVDEQTAAMAKIGDDIAASNDDLLRSRDLLGKTQAMVERGYDRVAADRDRLAAALARADKRHDDVARQLGERCRELMAARRDATDWREIAEARDREAKAEAHPPVDRYRVQVWDAADADLPSWGWSSISSARDTADEAVELMARRRERRPEFGPMRVIRVRESYTVVATEDPKPEKPPQSPQDAPVDPETRATG